MSYATIASTSYTVREGTYTIEVQEEGASAANHDLKVLERPRYRTSPDGHPLYGLKTIEMRLRVVDEGQLLTDKVDSGSALKLVVSGPVDWQGPLDSLEPHRDFTRSNPEVDLTFTSGVDALDGISYDLSGKLTLVEIFYQLLSRAKGPSVVRVLFDWTHSGQTSSRHPANAIRVPASDLRFGTNDERSYRSVLDGLLRFWNCDLIQADGRFVVRHLASLGGTMAAIDYDGATKTRHSVNRDHSVSTADFVRRVNGSSIPLRAPTLQGIGRSVSRYEYDRTPFQNLDFTEWNDSFDRPLEWDLQGNADRITKQSGEWVRLLDRSTHLEQAANGPFFGSDGATLKLEWNADPKSGLSDGVYPINLALFVIDNVPDGAPRYVTPGGNITTTKTYWQGQISVVNGEVGNSSGVIQTSAPRPSDPEQGAPRLRLLWDPDGSQAANYVELRIVQWPLTYGDRPHNARISTATGEGSSSAELTASLGSRRDWNPRRGVVEYYDGSSWVPAAEGWRSEAIGLHEARLIERLEQRRRRLRGLDAAYDRWTLNTPAALPVYDGTTHLVQKTDQRLGDGIVRHEAYPLRPFAASSADVLSEVDRETDG